MNERIQNEKDQEARSRSDRIQSVKGMPDIMPKEIPLWQRFESLWRQLMSSYGYEEIRSPIVENTKLFKRSIGEVTDIVEKEMFTFMDNDGDSISLRPEATAGCVRAGIEHGILYHNTQRLWYMGPMFRYENPQKGRFRQFHQAGAEAFGFKGPDIEVEHILMLARLWRWLGIEEVISLQINSLGSKESRSSYRAALIDYFSKYRSELDDDSQRRLNSNPLRILDSKNKQMADIIQNAPQSYHFLNAEDKAHFEAFQQCLTDARIPFKVNPRIVRGLDYYNRTVYEWISHSGRLGAQNAIAAGGRFDTLVEQLGEEPTPGVGFALGIERVVLLLEEFEELKSAHPDVYFIAVGESASRQVLLKAEKLRDVLPRLKVLVHCGGGNFKTQFRRADKSGARIALILGENELSSGTVSVKFLREDREQISIAEEEIGRFLNEYFSEKVTVA